MRGARKQYYFRKLKEFIDDEDATSIAHVLRWVYRKEELFDLKNDDGLTLIHIACFEGQRNCLEIFLRNGASVNLQSSVGWTPLHAATLGGKLEVVEFLLGECSANPLSKDEMGCLPSDLTMDSEILQTLNKYADELRIKRDVERLAATLAAEESSSPARKRNTFSFEIVENNSTAGSVPSRTQYEYEYVNRTEAKQIREQYSRNKSIGGKGLLEVPELPPFGAIPENTDNYLTRHNSAPIQKSPTFKTNAAKELHNNKVIENAAQSPSPSPGSPRATRFFTRDSGKRGITKTPEIRNRDSGVFEEETEHYNVI